MEQHEELDHHSFEQAQSLIQGDEAAAAYQNEQAVENYSQENYQQDSQYQEDSSYQHENSCGSTIIQWRCGWCGS